MSAFHLDPHAPPAAELRRIALAQIDEGLADLDEEDPHRAVHKVRQRGKKVRALLRLVRPAAPALYRQENATVRDMTRPLSTARDHGVAVETYDHLLERVGEEQIAAELAPVREALEQRRAAVLGEDLAAQLDTVRRELRAASERVQGWELGEDGFDAYAGGLAKTYRRARARMADAFEERTSAMFHQWRKRAKYHRHHLELLEAAWPPVMAAHREQVHELTDLLGDDHDLAVLREDLTAEPERFGGERPVAVLCGLLDRRRAELQVTSRGLGARCFAEEPSAMVDRVRGYWTATEDAAGGPLSDPVVPPGR